MSIEIGIIRGNGIGPEIMDSTLCVMEAVGLDFKWIPIAIGDEGISQYGHPLPQESVKQLKKIGLAIKAPLLVDKFKGRLHCVHEDGTEGIYASLNNAIRRELGLFVCPRPIAGFKNISGKYEALDVHIMREITEDVYSGIEHMIGNEAAECIKLTTRAAAERVSRYSFEYAKKYNRKKVSCIHKANAISMADGLFLSSFRKVAEEFPMIESDDYMVDAAAFFLAKDPGKFDVMVCPNQYGDILSDLAAGLVGSLGLAPGVNVGEGIIVAEASHGAAPDIAGKGIVNPVALILSGAALLNYIGKGKEAILIQKAVTEIISEGKYLTRDLGGSATTSELTKAIAERIKTYDMER
jgi:isocitrate dehydrogenase (NAD+)